MSDTQTYSRPFFSSFRLHVTIEQSCMNRMRQLINNLTGNFSVVKPETIEIYISLRLQV